MSNWWHNLRKSRRGGSRQYKAKIIEQNIYEWLFVRAQRSGRNRWVVSLFSRPIPDKNAPGAAPAYYSFTFYGNDRDVIAKGNEHNTLEQEKWDALMAKLKAKRAKEHANAAAKRLGGHRPGPIKDCPACNLRTTRWRTE